MIISHLKRLFTFCLVGIAMQSAAQDAGQTANCGPVPATCTPATLAGGLGHGIFLVTFHQINNASSNPPMLEDFTCSDSTILIPDSSYTFYVQTGSVYEESVAAWIDYSNDGIFDPSELIYSDSANLVHHSAVYTVPSSLPFMNTPLRLRIGSDYTGMQSLNGCADAYYGQYEDYTIFFGLGTGLSETGAQPRIAVYPNPVSVSGNISLANLPYGAHLFQLFDAFGQNSLTQQISFENPEIDPGDLAPGVYFYLLTKDDNVTVTSGRICVQ